MAFAEAVVFMEWSNCTEYYYGLLRPGIDFIPVAEDFSDLPEKLHALHAEPDRAARIARNWRQRAAPIFSLSCTLDYIEALLVAYAKLQQFTPPERADWKIYDLRDPESYVVKYVMNLTGHTALSLDDCPGYAAIDKKARNHNILAC